jgi:hypothetical protein
MMKSEEAKRKLEEDQQRIREVENTRTGLETLQRWKSEEETRRKRAQEMESERIRKELERRKKEEDDQVERWETKKKKEAEAEEQRWRQGLEMADRNQWGETGISDKQERIGRGEEEAQQNVTGRGVKFTSEGGMKTGADKKTERPRSNIMTFDQIRERESRGGYISNGGGITLQQVASTPVHRFVLSGSPTISPSTPLQSHLSTPFRAFAAEETLDEPSNSSTTSTTSSENLSSNAIAWKKIKIVSTNF